MHSKVLRVLAVAVSAAFVACGPGKLQPAAFMSWCNSTGNSLVQEHAAGDYTIRMQYRPAAFMALTELGVEEAQHAKAFDEALTHYKGFSYFNLKVTTADKKSDVLKAGIADQAGYFARIKYFSEEIQADLKMVIGSDTIPCAIHHFERVYQMSPFLDVMLAFEKPMPGNQPVTIIYNDRALGVGPQYFEYPAGTAAGIPEVTIP